MPKALERKMRKVIERSLERALVTDATRMIRLLARVVDQYTVVSVKPGRRFRDEALDASLDAVLSVLALESRSSPVAESAHRREAPVPTPLVGIRDARTSSASEATQCDGRQRVRE
ncbi:hypothetical protein [Lysobacter sp.]|uniref:hypothetical protein n=1 Tax=Lysobacter sp. TaxID=72226 RepID=UPI002D2E7C77|nr:hypothetical protein [Lysobacter sp.]HZX77287.1 hypothetical protein [Lysobacter sp.]